MTLNLLITGAGGYIGGSILTDFADGKGDVRTNVTLHAAVRSEEQANSLKALDVSVLQTDLNDSEGIESYVLNNGISMIIHTATSIDPAVAFNLISALEKQKKRMGKDVYFINTSGLSAFDEVTSWPFGEVRDTDAVLDMERKSADSYVVRKVDVLAADKAESLGVTFFNVMPPTIHGRGSGPWNKLSPQLPGLIRGSLSSRRVRKFADNRTCPFVHISDLTTFYALLVRAIIREDKIPSGAAGYYFVVSHQASWWDVAEHMASALHGMGLIETDVVEVWESDEQAAEALGVPAKFAYSIFNSGTKVIGDNPQKLGWVPLWNRERMLSSMGDEVDDVLELGQAKSSLLSSLGPKSG